jgi:murein DD-endopeptidase MepM/ murein hydrolase activator NlpD
MNLFVAGGVFSIFMVLVTTVIIAFTPLREYIPGYGSVAERRKLLELSAMTDSMENQLLFKDYFIQNIQNLVLGKESVETFQVFKDSSVNYREIENIKSPEDSALRAEMSGLEHGGGNTGIKNRAIVFMPPVKGMISAPFMSGGNHAALDITASNNEAVKAVADGTVLLSAYTAETGHVLIVQHASEFISVYKHNASRLKKQGEFVKAGEPIAFIGNSGELTSGPHLHFELWLKGRPVNPTDYITF